MKKAGQKIANILCEVYGAGVLTDPLTVIWASDRIEDATEAKIEVQAINKIRAKHGVIPVYIPFNHRLFAA